MKQVGPCFKLKLEVDCEDGWCRGMKLAMLLDDEINLKLSPVARVLRLPQPALGEREGTTLGPLLALGYSKKTAEDEITVWEGILKRHRDLTATYNSLALQNSSGEFFFYF